MDFLYANLTELALYFSDANQRLFWGYLVSAICLAVFAFYFGQKSVYNTVVGNDDKSAEVKPNLIHFLFPRGIYFSHSASNDYLLLVLNKLIKALLFPSIIITMVPVALSVSDSFEFVFGYLVPVDISTSAVMIIFTLLLFVFDDFTRFFLHYILHKVPLLWAFHKVHHSAKVLTPFTVYRSHPVENFLYACRMALTQGFVVGLCYYFFGPTLKMIDIIGANLFVFAFNIMGSNLRHSHVWLSWGDKVEQYFLSPAQHQIHHSDNVKHFDKNFGTALAIWDRLFNTCVYASTAEKIKFGIGKQGDEHNNIVGIYVNPFKEFFLLIADLITRKNK